MITLDCEQGSQEWVEARLGIPTASEFSRIVTSTGKLSASRGPYLGELLAEYCLGETYSDFGMTEWMERGKVLEPSARKYYSFHRDADVESVGFCYRDQARMVGCSPDGLVGGDDGLLELKCPSPGKHVFWLAQGVLPREHFAQCQGALWVTGRPWIDFMSFHPQLPPLIVRAEPDPSYQAALNKHIPAVIEEILSGRERLKELGAVLEPEEVV